LFPDGNTNAVYFMTNFTPRTSNTLGPAVPPHIQSVSVSSDGLVALTFRITAGKNYRIEFKDDLAAPEWTPLGADQTADASSVTVHDFVSGRTQRFYRVVLVN